MTVPPIQSLSVKFPTGETNASLLSLIKQQPFFIGLKEEHLRLLAAEAMVINFAEGAIILEEGGPANRFYLILEGRVSFEMNLDPNGETIVIQTFGPGEDLGWSWLFAPYVLHYSARALSATRTIFFYGTRLREECEQDHEFGFELMKRVATVATQCLQGTQQRLIAKIAGRE